jgi:hypothetical protein
VLLVEAAPALALARDVLEDLVGLDQAGALDGRRDDGGGGGGVPVPDDFRDAVDRRARISESAYRTPTCDSGKLSNLQVDLSTDAVSNA